MTFDAGTWWLLTVIVTTVVGLVGFLFGRSVFRQLDENRADIKEVRENYTPRTDHQKDLEAVRREMKEMRTEMRTEIRQMSDDVKDIKENCIRREEFVSHQLKLENKLDRLMEFMMKQEATEMDENELRRKMQAGELAANNGTVMRTLAIAGCDFKFLKLKSLLLALAGGMDRMALCSSINYLADSGYLQVRCIEDKAPSAFRTQSWRNWRSS